MHSSLMAIGLGEERRHELDKFRERVAVSKQNSRSTLSKEKPFPACLLRRWQMTHSAPWRFGGVTLGLLKRDASCTLVSH
jgi:hypothetical protein